MAKNRQYKNWQIVLASTLVVGVTLTYSATHSFAQNITLDGTLGTAETLTGPSYQIPQSSGKTVGNNLFHSFGKFNLNADEAAIFESSNNIRNILSRVTGGTPSAIDGLIRTLGSDVNFFLINPNGIIFGQNARLDVSGSFVASTANAIQFGNLGFFSATNPELPSPLLTINPSALFFNQIQAEKIHLYGLGNNLIYANPTIRDDRPVGLEVDAARTLALVGGEMVLEGGNLTALDGRIELGAVQGNSLVTLSATDSGWVLGYEDVESFQDIRFTQAASADASGNVGGSIQVQGRRVSLTDGSAILVNVLGTGGGGSLNVTASESVRVSGSNANFQFGSGLFAENSGTGKGGDIKITAPILLVEDSGQVATGSFDQGSSGNVIVNASELVQLIGAKPAGPFPTVIGNGALGTGDAGDITINTRSLIVQNGAYIGGGVYASGEGPIVTINASESVQIIGTTGIVKLPETSLVCGLKAFCQGEFPSGMLADTFAEGNGGNFTINTRNLIVRDGAQISVSTAGSGKGGNLTVNASESIQLIGRSKTSAAVIPIGFSADGELVSGLFAASGQVGFFNNPEATGEGGNIIINTNNLIIRDGSQIAVSGLGLVKAGEQIISAESVLLDQGKITAETISGDGGNLKLEIYEILQLRNQSQISTTAGNQQSGGNGGNITINALFIVAVPKESSDITANAFTGNGGRVDITTNGIFGILPQERPTQLSDITASSELGVSGQVTINTPDVDPSHGLVQLPSNVVDASGQIASGCSPRGRKTASRFIATGRGGLPLSPNEPLRGQAVIKDWVNLPEQITNVLPEEITVKQPTAVANNLNKQIVEAQGWIFRPNGDVILLAQSPQISSIPSSSSC